ncbi:MAG: sulfatase [bacterium]
MSNKPNILLILTDQLRKDTLGCYGNERVNTPNIDFIAKDGIKFNRCYVANQICMPNRMSIFTGMYPRNHGLWTNGLLLPEEKPTLTSIFKENNYNTASIGKIHFNPYGAEAESGSMESRSYWKNLGDDFNWNGPYWNFDHVELTIGHTSPVAHYGKWFRDNGGTEEMLEQRENGVRNLPPELHDSTFVAERTINYIKNNKEEPFFLVSSFPDPHHPFNPPKECTELYSLEDAHTPIGSYEDLNTRPSHYLKHFKGGWHRKGKIKEQHPDGISSEKEKTRIINTYAMVDLIDDNIGKIINTLKEENLFEDTIIIFTSDHGELLGDHGLWYKGPFYYEGLINIPLLINFPDSCQIQETDSLISSIDILPTICEYLGFTIPEWVDGVSHVNHLFNKSQKIRDNCLIEYRNGYGKNDCASMALITENYKYIRYQTGEKEFTDLEKDPFEKENMAYKKEYKNLVDKMNYKLTDAILSTQIKWPEQISHA